MGSHRYMRMFCARSCKFCEQPEARISMVRAVRGVRAVLVDFSGRTPCRWHRWEGWLSPCGCLFLGFLLFGNISMPRCAAIQKNSLLQNQVQIANRVVNVFTSRGWRLGDGLRDVKTLTTWNNYSLQGHQCACPIKQQS